MSDSPSSPALAALRGDPVFPVEYDEFAGQSFEASARGRGTLAIEGAGPSATYTFTGPSAPSLSLGGELAFTFDAGKIRNVSVDGTRIEFIGTLRSGLAPEWDFAFHCTTPEEAAVVARLFPATQDAAFTASREFYRQFDRLPVARSPWTSVTGLIVIANVVVFVAMGFAGAGWVTVAGMDPYVRFGANHAALTTQGQWWRLVASMFLHYGLVHLGLNMWALFEAGQLLERLLSRSLYILVYFGSGLLGSLTTLAWHGKHGVWSAGASGAVFGVFGALAGYMLRQQHTLPATIWQPLLKSVAASVGYNLVFGMLIPGIDNAAHVGGLLGGLMLGWLVALPLDPASRRQQFGPSLRHGIAALAVAIALGVAFAPRF